MVDRALEDQYEDKEGRLTRVLKDIADSIMPGIKMETAHPKRNYGKMPIIEGLAGQG